ASQAIEMDSSNRQAQIVYARALAALQGNDYGENHLRELITAYPLIFEYRLELGRLYLEDEKYNDAQVVFEQLLNIQEKPKEALIELGKVLTFKNEPAKALEYYFRAAVFDPADVEPFFLAGRLLLGTGKPQQAKEQFERVIAINNNYPLVRYQIGLAELMLKNPKKALEQANEEKRINPKLSAPYTLAAEAYSEMKQFELCAREYQQAIKLKPLGAEIYIKVAACYRKSGSFDSALSMLNIAAKTESGNPDIYKEQGALFESRGDIAKAIQSYDQYFLLNPNAPDKALIEKRIQSLQNKGIR
ncbi:MAG: tetratricopeptide repeat protein, partial [Bdellovibrionales bacterium]|nr:tetratricopeptide repeat protein [Bdellovibrionales bacterium]